MDAGRALAALSLLSAAWLSGCVQQPQSAGATEAPRAAAASTGISAKEPPGGSYVKACTIAPLPCFFPGLGTLYVQPKTLPAGPFQAYDRNGDLVSTIYMIPVADLDAHKKHDDLASSPLPVTFVDIYYNAGHPGVPMPHYHIVLWHVSRERALSLQ
jgi:hypothetical protein